MRPQRPCLDCGQVTRNPKGRCKPCEAAYQKAREKKPARAVYRGDSRRFSREQRALEPWCHRTLPDGTTCRATQDLTWDHETRTVQCRPCNSSHRGTTVPTRYATTLDPDAYRRQTRD